MIYITGDTHGRFERIASFCETQNTLASDILVILGDAGINYYCNKRDVAIKKQLASLPITLFCIHGNHEKRPQNIKGYELADFCEGKVYVQPEYPNILFAKDGQVFRLDGKLCLVCGGAYSVDKSYRLSMGFNWWADEQPDDAVKFDVELALLDHGFKVDYVMTHTCPFRYIPTEMFLPCIDQSQVDNSTEEWLGSVEERVAYDKWFCGHYHTNKSIDKVQFLFDDIYILK